jgi:hypothetical protein
MTRFNQRIVQKASELEKPAAEIFTRLSLALAAVLAFVAVAAS